jgi:release factor glutamine methyltransferase
MLIREAMAQGSADLKFAEINTPSLDSSLLLAHILNTDRTSLIARGTEKLSEKNCALFCELIERRANGECTAYIIGKKEFMGLEFSVNKSVLVPRPDTETLVETSLEILKKKLHHEASIGSKINILDLCTGSGAVAISIKHKMPQLEVYAVEICEKALEVAKKNATRLLPVDSHINFYQGDLYNALRVPSDDCKITGDFSLIVSNPPYVSTGEIDTLSEEVQNEPKLALNGGLDGLDIIKRIIEKTSCYLSNGGSLLLEADPRQMDEIKKLLANNGFINIQLYKDLSDSNRVIGGIYEK